MKKKSAAPAAEKRSELFYSGRDCRAFDYMGAHPFVQDGEQGYLFRVYAPEAEKVSVMGEFNDWNRDADYMTRDEQGIWEKFIPNIPEYAAYKYSVWAKSGDVFTSPTRTASISRPVRATPPRRPCSHKLGNPCPSRKARCAFLRPGMRISSSYCISPLFSLPETVHFGNIFRFFHFLSSSLFLFRHIQYNAIKKKSPAILHNRRTFLFCFLFALHSVCREMSRKCTNYRQSVYKI